MRAGVGAQVAGELADERGLAGAVRADDGVRLAFLDLQESTPSVARSAPKVLVSDGDSQASGLVEDAREAAAEEDHRQDQQRAEDHLPVLRSSPASERPRRSSSANAPITGPDGGRHAAEDHHEHQIARLLPAHQAGRDVVGVVGVQRAGEAAHRAGDDEGGEAVGVGREADGARARARSTCVARNTMPNLRVHNLVSYEYR